MTDPSPGYLARQFGRALVEQRHQSGTSQRAQAKALGIAGTTLRELELGLANPTLERVEETAEKFGLLVELVVTSADR